MVERFRLLGCNRLRLLLWLEGAFVAFWALHI